MVCRFCQVAKPLVRHQTNTCPAYLRYEIKYGKLEVEKRHRLNDDALHPEWHFDKMPLEPLIKYIEKCEKALLRAEKRIADAMKASTLPRQA
jgi:hypothetical protein